MLYERWREVSAEHRNEWALLDSTSGRRWTFGQLDAESQKCASHGPIVYPRGNSPEFIFSLLAAWRENRVVCPLEADQAQPEIPSPPHGCLHLKTTSATTGAPRLVAVTDKQLAADAENIVATMGLRSAWPNLGVISMAHSYGFSNLTLPLFLHGIPLVLVPAPLPELVRRASANLGDITLAAVPAMWRAWHDARVIPANTRLALSAGAPLPLSLEQAVFAASSVKIHNFLGSSECGGIAYDGTETPRSDAACAGAPLRNVSVSLNSKGCLAVRGPAVAQSYWPTESEMLGGGVFQTSDLAELKDGLVFLRGRLSDQINVAGRKISPETIERALLAHPGVRECLVFGAPSGDSERAEIIVAVVAGKAGEAVLKNFLLERVPAWQVPREWRFVDSLSANGRGKAPRSEWRERWLGAGQISFSHSGPLSHPMGEG